MKRDPQQQRLEILLQATDIKFKRGSTTEHAKSCECLLCTRARLAAFQARAKLAVQGGAKPENAEQTIPVRAHWRQGKNHLKNDPALRELVRSIVRELLEESRKGKH